MSEYDEGSPVIINRTQQKGTVHRVCKKANGSRLYGIRLSGQERTATEQIRMRKNPDACDVYCIDSDLSHGGPLRFE